MTPFGEKVRELRKERGISQKQMAKKLAISSAYLSALEHGHRGRPSWPLIQQIISFFNIIWDEAEELESLARISHPRIVVNTSGLSAEATELVNLLNREIRNMKQSQIEEMLNIIKNKD
ncbi:MAG: helix-turn-helix transcriptional regulator [Emcibacteraceae bacterium]|jgi:transcriptional regulator with XRE-family HTH domain|uniref:helix-turn-helix domain-containing protein n=1 Tax=Pseudemcibacter sp. TaxID=2943293 RepID=UPI00230980E2|nr:helix-turn-helix domain-containing protein [Emcibacteraceae bacterium]MDA9553268.1 helix-turn-helix domain-containing protein [Emcibacteraceae bacterium]MDG1726571.1 helix-turn-helix transcriptional regulator [Emcibacteraceae bacterium]